MKLWEIDGQWDAEILVQQKNARKGTHIDENCFGVDSRDARNLRVGKTCFAWFMF